MRALFMQLLAGAVLVASAQGLLGGEGADIPKAAKSGQETADNGRERAEETRKKAIERAAEANKPAQEGTEEERGRGPQISERAKKLGPRAQGLHDLVDAATQSALKPLENAFAKVPEEAKGSIRKAIEEVRAGNAAALKGLRDDLAGMPDEDAALEVRGQELARQRVAEVTKKHTQVLAGFLGVVPDEARPAIERAIEESKAAWETALKALKGVGKPEGVGKPKRAGKPEGIAKPAWIGKPEGVGKPAWVGRPEGKGVKAPGRPTFTRPGPPQGK